MGVQVGVAVWVQVCVQVGLGVGVHVGVAVCVHVCVRVGLGVGVHVGVSVGDQVGVRVGLGVAVQVGVGVCVQDGVWVDVRVGVPVGVEVGVNVGVEGTQLSTTKSLNPPVWGVAPLLPATAIPKSTLGPAKATVWVTPLWVQELVVVLKYQPLTAAPCFTMRMVTGPGLMKTVPPVVSEAVEVRQRNSTLLPLRWTSIKAMAEFAAVDSRIIRPNFSPAVAPTTSLKVTPTLKSPLTVWYT